MFSYIMSECFLVNDVVVICYLHVRYRMADLSLAPMPPSASALSAPMSGLSAAPASVDPYGGLHDPAAASAAQRGFSALRVAAPPAVATFGAAAPGSLAAVPQAAQLLTPSVAATQLYTQYP